MVGTGPVVLWTILQVRWPMLADYLQTAPEAAVLFRVRAGRLPASTLASPIHPPRSELRGLMNHREGPDGWADDPVNALGWLTAPT